MELRALKSYFENGQMVSIQEDVLGVLQQIREISDRIHVFFNKQTNEFDLVEIDPQTRDQHLIFSVVELDPRVIHRLREADQWRGREDPTYVLPDEEDWLSKIEAQEEIDDRLQEEENRDRIYEAGERLAWALEEDGKGTKASILVPRSLNGNGSR